MTQPSNAMSIEALLQESPHLAPTPIIREFYDEVIESNLEAKVIETHMLEELTGTGLELDSGQVVTLRLLDGPQIVNLFAMNLEDPDERIWQQGVIREGLYASRYTRFWGTMARYRPLMTVIEDTVTSDPRETFGVHHILGGGSGTPADWRFAGGDPGVKSTWEQFADVMVERGVSPSLLRENVCLFQKSDIERNSQRIVTLPSDARKGDQVSLFAEIPLCVLLALSPYVDGSRPATQPGVPIPNRVEVTIREATAEPLGWPYPGVSYPDLSPYLDDSGKRSDEATPTVGIDYTIR